MKWKGEILLESLSDPAVVDNLHVDSIEEIIDDDGLWHVYHVSVEESHIASILSSLQEGPWFVHFQNEGKTIVAFKDASFTFFDTDQEAISKVKEHARKLSIPEEEMRFTSY